MENKGFTLIELVVVMAVFLLIMGSALGIFISIVQHQKRVLSQQELLNQASYFVEQMTKGLRMARKDLTGDCLGTPGYVYLLEDLDGNTGKYRSIKFINASDTDITRPDGSCQKYCLDNSDPDNPVLKELKNRGKDGNWSCGSGTQATSTNLKINSLGFILNGDSNNSHVPVSLVDTEQPRVTVLLDVKFQGGSNQPTTKVQTTVSQRDLNK